MAAAGELECLPQAKDSGPDNGDVQPIQVDPPMFGPAAGTP
jgi:hypothetical protein